MRCEGRAGYLMAVGALVLGNACGGASDSTGPDGNSTAVASVTVEPASASLAVGATLQLGATLRASTGAAITGKNVTWASSSVSLATVSASGLVTGVAVGGPVSITATSEGVSGSATITLTPAAIATITLAPATAALPVGSTVALTATLRDVANNVLTDRAVVWSTSNAALATVSSTGLVTGVAVGGPVVIAAAAEGRTGSASITVLPVPVATVSVSPGAASLGVGGALQMSVTLRDANNNVVTGRAVAWSSSNAAIAPVSNAGVVTGVAIGGPVTITATSEGRSGSAQVTVGSAVNPLALGNFHSCFLKADGSAYCWGNNTYGQLGDGTTTSRFTPVAVSGGRRFTALAGGNFHTCGLVSDGSAYCWGRNQFGQLGDGTTSTRLTPTPVSGGLAFTSITAGGDYVSTLEQINAGHTCALTATGAAYCWGYGPGGALGNGSGSHQSAPVAVSGSLSFKMLDAGNRHTCGLTNSGSAYCWGTNSSGELGDGTTVSRSLPVAVTGGNSFATISAGGWGHVCAATASGVTYCWGDNSDGQLGDGTTTGRTQPTPVSGGLSFVMLSTAGWLITGHSCGLTNTGTVYCWGNNSNGEIGDGTTSDRVAPTRVSGSASYLALMSQWLHSCAVTSASDVYCWGQNGNGQLGDGSTNNRSAPVRVPIP